MSVSTDARHSHPDADDVVAEMTPYQYRQARAAALRSIGMTYNELAKEAREGRFSSVRAKKVWIAFGRYTGR